MLLLAIPIQSQVIVQITALIVLKSVLILAEYLSIRSILNFSKCMCISVHVIHQDCNFQQHIIIVEGMYPHIGHCAVGPFMLHFWLMHGYVIAQCSSY